MARSRNIRPGYFDDEATAALSRDARYFFIALWTHADRDGRLEDRPLQLAAKVYPYDSPRPDGEALLAELAAPRTHGDGGFIIRYEIDGKRLIQIRNFKKHQNIHPDERRSTLPEPVSSLSVSRGVQLDPIGSNTITLEQIESTPVTPLLRYSVTSDNGQTAGRQGAPGELEAAQAECQRELMACAEVTGHHPDGLLIKFSRTPHGKSISRIDTCDSVRWLTTAADRLRTFRLATIADQEIDVKPPPKPTVQSHAERVGAEWAAERKAAIDGFGLVREAVSETVRGLQPVRGQGPVGRPLPGASPAERGGVSGGGPRADRRSEREGASAAGGDSRARTAPSPPSPRGAASTAVVDVPSAARGIEGAGPGERGEGLGADQGSVRKIPAGAEPARKDPGY